MLKIEQNWVKLQIISSNAQQRFVPLSIKYGKQETKN